MMKMWKSKPPKDTKVSEGGGEDVLQVQEEWLLHWRILFLKDYTQWKGALLKRLMTSCSWWEGPVLELFVKHDSLRERPRAG